MTERTSFTPGPWFVYEPEAEPIRIATSTMPDGIHVCTINGRTSDALADARLIAAAPELLAALQDACTLLDGWINTKCPMRYRAEHRVDLDKKRAIIARVHNE